MQRGLKGKGELNFKMSPSLTSLILQLGVLSLLAFGGTFAAFGDAFNYGRDDTFDNMGEAKIAEFTVTNSEEGFCADGWEKYEGMCYFPFDNGLAHEGAEAFCLDTHGASLAVVSSQNINDFLTGLVEGRANSEYVIGLTSNLTGPWVWTDGTTLDYEAWGTGEPSIADGCVELVYDASGSKWITFVCIDTQTSHICQRPTVPGQAHLYISFEDTFQVDEMWLFDFQPYEFGGATPIVTTGLGSLVADNTGTCSSVFTNTTFDSVDGFYKDHFRPTPEGDKELFQTFVRGSTYAAKGSIQVREDLLTFDGEMERLFGCEDSVGNNVWVQVVNQDSIQFNTTLYMTNIRPRYTNDGTLEPSYVQSYVVLYWRLLRVAISRFLISSVERLRPIFEYATVSAVYVNNDVENGIDRARAEVEISFWTVTALHPADTMISVYKPASLIYTPANPDNSLEFVKDVPDLGCELELGMADNSILDEQITASTFLEDDDVFRPKNGRLNALATTLSAGAWFAGVGDATPYIEVTFIAETTVSGVVTQGQGSNGDFYWVTNYKIKYDVYTAGSMSYITDEEGTSKDFTANFDWNTPVTNYFPVPIRTQNIRIEPTNTNTGTVIDGQVAMRFELLGCRDSLPVRLVDGNSRIQGRVEVYSYDSGTWGTVCGNSWSTNAATVVCRQLGYRYAESYVDDGTMFFGEGTLPILLDNVLCDGREADLLSCSWGNDQNCTHAQDIGVICSTDVIPTEPSVRLVDGTYHYEGRVEVWHNGEWGTICDDSWGIQDAHVVCRELGFADAKEAVVAGRYGEGEDMPVWLDTVNCEGDEASLDLCPRGNDWGVTDCTHIEDAGVVCVTDSPHQSVSDMAVLDAPPCNYTFWPGGCTQHWQFTVVLEVDTSNAVNRMPIDATGEFEFRYYLYECPDITAENAPSRDTCNRIEVPDAIISHQLTLQTTVEVTDAKKDSPLVEVVSVYGTDPSRDLRFNLYAPGVSHLETVTVETKFFPEFLRLTLELELTLFMVCVGEQYKNMRDGCLAAPADQRYTAFTHPEFYYTQLEDQELPEGNTIDLTADDITSSSQELETYAYIPDQEIHRSTFINKALSAESRLYTITNVFQLVERGTGIKRERRNVVRRDIIDNAQAPVGTQHAIFFAGCPANSTHNGLRDCMCNEGLTYSTETFQCVPVATDAEETNELPIGESPSGDEELDNVVDVFFQEKDIDSAGTRNKSGKAGLLISTICLILVPMLRV